MSREEQIIEAAMNAIQPVLENAVVVAAEYCKATGRDIVTALDMEYGMKWSAMKVTGRVFGSILPEGSDDDSDDEGWETDDDMVVQESEMGFDDEFREYDGDDERYLEVNQAVREWADWEPETELEMMLKNAVNSRR
jgi:hypothetical protein